MNQQTPLRERVANERRRLKAVRQALSAALEQGSKGDAAYVSFYLAIAEYMEAAMHRLHIQDVRMGDMIRSKLGTIDAEASAAIKELDDRLSGNQRHLERFLEARDALKREGVPKLGHFEQVSRDYTAFITANMGHHGATTELAQKLFSLDDWSYMAGVTEEETRHEQMLHERVFAQTPKGLKLPAAG
ncbi:MAG: hypothetical protein L6Q83_01895 [Gammaproteobacteria bacterium]|jgi:hypothetical protein|nr:hypothetical protein [Gammaproteobacteria bacterium]